MRIFPRNTRGSHIFDMKNSLFGKDSFDRDMNEELQLHVEMQTQAYISQGLTPEDAARRAKIDFGGLENIREEARDTRSFAWLAAIWRDLRIAVRGLVRDPWFSALCVFVITLAIGANTAVFSIINATFLRSLPYPEAERIVQIWELRDNGQRLNMNYLNFQDWRERQDSFSNMSMCISYGITLRDGMQSSRLQSNLVTNGYLDILGVKPTQGRGFEAEDDAPGAPYVCILTAKTWEEQFDSDPAVLGKSVQIDDRVTTIVGILPENFRHYQDVALFLPLGPIAESMYITARSNRYGNNVIARLATGVTTEAALSQLQGIAASLKDAYPQNKDLSAALEPLHVSLGQSAHERVIFLYGAVALFLLIACVNLSNMFLARGMARTREIAIRAALGATRLQLVRQLLIESLALSFVGGALGILLAWQASTFAGRLIPWEIRRTLNDGSAFDIRVCLFAVILTFAAGILFGLAPALRLSHTKPSGALKENGGATGPKGRLSGSDILAVAQVALVAVLLVSTGLLLRSLIRVLETPSGINSDNLITFQMAGPSASSFNTNPNALGRFYVEVLEHIQQMPGVESAAFHSSMPYTWFHSQMNVYRLDQPVPEYTKAPSCYSHFSSSDVFRTMGIPLLKGRLFKDNEPLYQYPEGIRMAPENFERLFGRRVIDMVINKRTSEMLWPGEDPIGKHLNLGPPGTNIGTAEVVGIVGNTIQAGVERGELPEFYINFRTLPSPATFFFAVRTHGDPSEMMHALRSSLSALRPDAPIHNMHLMEERMSWFVSERKFTVQMLSAFAIAALLLASAGIYGVLSYITARRTREIAIRLTLGASRGGVLADVVKHGSRLLGMGLGIGLIVSLFVQKLIQSQLFGVSGTDPATFIIGAIVLMAVGLVACFIPALRASRVDPMLTLRAN